MSKRGDERGLSFGLKCPLCGFLGSGVVDSRGADNGKKVKRRRECGGVRGKVYDYGRG